MQSLTASLSGVAAIQCFLLAAAAAACGAVVAPLLIERARAAAANARPLWIALAALALAVTIWDAQVAILLGVESVAVPGRVGFDLRLMAAALLIAFVVIAVGLAVADAQPAESRPILAACGGAIVGAGVAATHYVAWTAVRMPGRAVWDQPAIVAVAIVCVLLSAGAFALLAADRSTRAKLAGGALLASAVVSFHAVAIFAVDIAPNARLIVPPEAMHKLALVLVAGCISAAALMLALVAAFATWRSGDSRGESSRLQAFADLTGEGIVLCHELRIVDANVAAGRFMGLDPSALRGRAMRDFIDAPDPDRLLSASLAKPQEATLRSTGGENAWVEISSRDIAVQGRMRRVFTLRDLSETRRNEHQIRHLAYHDPLTGLANRAAFNEALSTALRRGGEVALFCVDLDKFKEVNDVFGHAAGDEVLRTASRRIVAAAPDAMVFRLGGDEFVVIGTGPDAGDADKLALRLTSRLNTETIVNGTTLRCGASVGFAVYPHHGANVDTLFANADAALYRAKADGRGLARGFEPDMDLALRERRALQQDLATAILRDEMFLHWMPQANTLTGEIVGFEALLRWKHPTRGVVPPVAFIPVAEETAAIVPIGEWVLRTACRTAVGWTRPGKVAVNLSPVQFQHGDIVALVHEILLETGLPAQRLELEITEGVLLHDLPGALQTLRRLKALGVQIAMDDFGTGYSSLSYLQAFPFDRIKIDASFIRTLSTSPQAKAIVRAVVALGASLDMPITAEGVETPEQRAFLAELDCEEIQGYLVGRPSPLISFESPFGRATRMRAVG